MRVNRKEVSYVAPGIGVRVSITMDHSGLTREELAQATTDLAGKVMLALSDTRFVKAPLAKIKVR